MTDDMDPKELEKQTRKALNRMRGAIRKYGCSFTVNQARRVFLGEPKKSRTFPATGAGFEAALDYADELYQTETVTIDLDCGRGYDAESLLRRLNERYETAADHHPTRLSPTFKKMRKR